MCIGNPWLNGFGQSTELMTFSKIALISSLVPANVNGSCPQGGGGGTSAGLQCPPKALKEIYAIYTVDQRRHHISCTGTSEQHLHCMPELLGNTCIMCVGTSGQHLYSGHWFIWATPASRTHTLLGETCALPIGSWEPFVCAPWHICTRHVLAHLAARCTDKSVTNCTGTLAATCALMPLITCTGNLLLRYTCALTHLAAYSTQRAVHHVHWHIGNPPALAYQ